MGPTVVDDDGSGVGKEADSEVTFGLVGVMLDVSEIKESNHHITGY